MGYSWGGKVACLSPAMLCSLRGQKRQSAACCSCRWDLCQGQVLVIHSPPCLTPWAFSELILGCLWPSKVSYSSRDCPDTWFPCFAGVYFKLIAISVQFRAFPIWTVPVGSMHCLGRHGINYSVNYLLCGCRGGNRWELHQMVFNEFSHPRSWFPSHK